MNPATVQDASGHAVAGTFDFVENGSNGSSTDVTDTVLDAGSYDLSVTFNPTDTTDYSSVTTTASITITPAKIAIVADSPANITYGVSSPILTNTLYTDLGPDPNIPGQDDYQELDSTALASVAYTNALGGAPAATTDATLSAGDHTINPTDISTLSPTTARIEFLNDFDVVYGTGTLTVTPATLTVTGITASDKVYDSTTTATLNADGAALVGVVSGDSVTLNTGGAAGIFASKDAGTNITVQVSGLTISGPQAGDYTLTQPTTSANITPAALTISAVSDTKVYDGTTSSSQTPTYQVTGLAADTLYGTDTVSATQAFGSKDVLGTGLSTLSVTAYTVNDGNGGADYTVDSSGTALGSITPASLTISAVTDTKVYDGTTSSSATPSHSTLYDGDTVSATQAFGSKDVLGTGLSTLSVTAYTVNDGNGGADYTVDSSGTALGSITPASLTISAVTDTKVYDGTTSSSATPSHSTLYDGDTVSATQAFGSKDVLGTGLSTLSVTAYTVNDGNGGADYTVDSSGTALGSITPATLTVTGITASDKVYDSTNTATLNPDGAAPVGVVSGDSVTLNTGGAAGIFASKDAGTNITVQVSGLTISGPQAGDYTLTQPTTSANITPAALTISAVSDTKVYDGTTSSSQTPTYQVTGLAADTLYGTDTVSATQAFGSKDVLGTGLSTLSVTAYTVNDGNGGADYTVDSSGTALGSITPASLTISAVTDTKVYDGTTSSSATPSHSTLYDGDTVSATQAFGSKDVLGTGLSTLSVTAYTVNDGNGGADYTVDSSGTALGSITPATLTVTGITASDKVYDSTNTATLNPDGAAPVGVVSGDSVTLNTGGAAGIFASKDAGTNITVQVSGLTISGPQAGDYTLTQPTTRRISPRRR